MADKQGKEENKNEGEGPPPLRKELSAFGALGDCQKRPDPNTTSSEVKLPVAPLAQIKSRRPPPMASNAASSANLLSSWSSFGNDAADAEAAADEAKKSGDTIGYVCVCVCASAYMCMCTCGCGCGCACTCTCACRCGCACACACTCACTCACACACACALHTHILTHTHTQTQKHTLIHAHAHTHNYKHTHSCIHAYIHTNISVLLLESRWGMRQWLHWCRGCSSASS